MYPGKIESKPILVGYVNSYIKSIRDRHNQKYDCATVMLDYTSKCYLHLSNIKYKRYVNLEDVVDSYNETVQLLFDVYSSYEEFKTEEYCLFDLSISIDATATISKSVFLNFFIDNQRCILITFSNHLINVLLANSELKYRLNAFISNKYSIEQHFTEEYTENIEKYSLHILNNLHKHPDDLVAGISEYNASFIDYVLDVLDCPEQFKSALNTIKSQHTIDNIVEKDEAVRLLCNVFRSSPNVLSMMLMLGVCHGTRDILNVAKDAADASQDQISLIVESISILEQSIVCGDDNIYFMLDEVEVAMNVFDSLSSMKELKPYEERFSASIDILNCILSENLNAIKGDADIFMMLKDAMNNADKFCLSQMWLLKKEASVESLTLLLLSVIHVAYELYEDNAVSDQLMIVKHMPEYMELNIREAKRFANKIIIAKDLLLDMTGFNLFLKNEEPFQDADPIIICKPRFI